MSAKAPLPTRFVRIGRIVCWLLAACRRINRLENATPARCNEVLAELCQSALKALDIRLNVPNPPPTADGTGRLVVSNHVSWLDIFTICALMPSSFIAMREMRSWPLIGKAAANIGTVFIDRSNRKDTDSINRALTAALQNGQNVCFFPEAKTSDGLNILPFKAALFQSAINAGVPVQALALRYYDAEGQRTSRPSFAQIGLLKSLWRVVSLKQIEIRADFLPVQIPAADADRFALKEKAQEEIGRLVCADSPIRQEAANP